MLCKLGWIRDIIRIDSIAENKHGDSNCCQGFTSF
jgi:hypothetical protein